MEASDEISHEFEFSDEFIDASSEEWIETGQHHVAEKVAEDGSSSGETAFRHHRASLNAMSKVWSLVLLEHSFFR